MKYSLFMLTIVLVSCGRRNFNPSASKLKSYWRDDLFSHSDRKYRLSYTLVQLEVQPTIRTQSDLIAHDDYLNILPHGTTILFDHYDVQGPSVKRLIRAMGIVRQARPDIKIEQSSRLFKKIKELSKNS